MNKVQIIKIKRNGKPYIIAEVNKESFIDALAFMQEYIPNVINAAAENEGHYKIMLTNDLDSTLFAKFEVNKS